MSKVGGSESRHVPKLNSVREDEVFVYECRACGSLDELAAMTAGQCPARTRELAEAELILVGAET